MTGEFSALEEKEQSVKSAVSPCYSAAASGWGSTSAVGPPRRGSAGVADDDGYRRKSLQRPFFLLRFPCPSLAAREFLLGSGQIPPFLHWSTRTELSTAG